MDLSTMIVDLLRNRKEEEILNRGGPIARPAPKAPGRDMLGPTEASAAVNHLANPLYTAYKREALSNGEPVLSPEEFKRAQAEGRF